MYLLSSSKIESLRRGGIVCKGLTYLSIQFNLYPASRKNLSISLKLNLPHVDNMSRNCHQFCQNILLKDKTSPAVYQNIEYNLIVKLASINAYVTWSHANSHVHTFWNTLYQHKVSSKVKWGLSLMNTAVEANLLPI